MEKIAENNPDLRICLAHSARFSADVLERAGRLSNCYVDSSALTIHCNIARSGDPTVPPPDQRFPADYTSPAKVLEALASTYPETILWGSDTPCHYFMQKVDFGNGYIEERKLKADFDAEISALNAIPDSFIQKISNQNTLKFIFGK